jgi:hypothetical protein
MSPECTLDLGTTWTLDLDMEDFPAKAGKHFSGADMAYGPAKEKKVNPCEASYD